MERAILIDRVMGAVPPTLASDADVRALEAVPLTERLAVSSTYEALRLGAAQDPARAAIHFLPNADPDEPGLPLSHGEFFRRVTQAANLFHHLGVGPNDVVSLMLPLLPQNFYAMFGAEAAGIANPVNPLLEPRQIAEILRAAGTKVLVALGPTPGTDIWAKVQAIRDQVPSLQTVLQVRLGPPAEGDTTPSFDEQLAAMPGDHLLSGRRKGFDDVAAYFHTGGTTGTPKLVRHTHLNQLSQAWGMAVMFPGPPGRCTLYGLPLYHVGGALSQALAGLVQAGTTRELGPDEVAAYDAPFPDGTYQASPKRFPALIPLHPDNPGVPRARRAWAYLETWEKPFLTLFGDQDPIAFAPGAHLQFQRRVPGAAGQPHVVLEGPNHFIQEDAPDELVDIIDRFIADTPG